MHEVERLWDEHRAAAFPKHRGEEVDGIDLVLLDADIAGCVSSYLTSRGVLDSRQVQVLRECRRDARAVAAALAGDGHAYFRRLERLADAVLRKLEPQPPAG